MFVFYTLTFFLGLGVGAVCISQVLFPVSSLLLRFREVQNITQLDAAHLLYLILRYPLIWATMLVCSILAVKIFFPRFLFVYLVGMTFSLMFVASEVFLRQRPQTETFIKGLRTSLVPTQPPVGSKYPEYSFRQMRLMGWGPVMVDVARYRDLPFECAYCHARRTLTKDNIRLEASGKRYVVECDICRQSSIVKIKGFWPSTYEVSTLARLPDHSVQGRTPHQEPAGKFNRMPML